MQKRFRQALKGPTISVAHGACATVLESVQSGGRGPLDSHCRLGRLGLRQRGHGAPVSSYQIVFAPSRALPCRPATSPLPLAVVEAHTVSPSSGPSESALPPNPAHEVPRLLVTNRAHEVPSNIF